MALRRVVFAVRESLVVLIIFVWLFLCRGLVSNLGAQFPRKGPILLLSLD